jgi:hypothetical protein
LVGKKINHADLPPLVDSPNIAASSLPSSTKIIKSISNLFKTSNYITGIYDPTNKTIQFYDLKQLRESFPNTGDWGALIKEKPTIQLGKHGYINPQTGKEHYYIHGINVPQHLEGRNIATHMYQLSKQAAIDSGAGGLVSDQSMILLQNRHKVLRIHEKINPNSTKIDNYKDFGGTAEFLGLAKSIIKKIYKAIYKEPSIEDCRESIPSLV